MTELNQAITKAVDYARRDGGDYERYIIEAPTVPTDIRNKIDLKFSELNVTADIDHSKFISLENGGLAVKISNGNSHTITYKDEANSYKENTDILKNEYQSLFGFDREDILDNALFTM